MTTKAQQLKKELTQAFPKLKFSVKTEKRRQSWSDTPIIYFIRLTVTGLIGSPYTKRQVEKIANKYRNDVTATYVTIKNIDGDSLYEEIMRMVPDYENNWETVDKIADNECFTVLPDGYYEEKMSLQNPQSQEVIDSAATEIIEEETIDTNDKWFDELFSDLTVGELAKEIESRMELIINNSFGDIFHSEISVNRLGDLLVATIDGVEYHVPSLLDTLCNYTDEDFDNGGYYDLFDYFRDCEYTPEASDIPENSTKQDSQAISEKTEYNDDYSKLKRRLYKLSWGELRKLCKFYGLSAKGDAIDIRRRIYDAGITSQKVDEFYYSY